MAAAISSLLLAEDSFETQFSLVVIWGVVWCCFIKRAAKTVFQPYISSKAWRDQWIDLTRKYCKSGLMVEFRTREGAFEFGCEFLAIMCQHGVGGCFCLPSVLGYTGSISQALACHGALCEAGWELQDVLDRAYQVVLGGQAGKDKNPPALLAIIFLHHAAGLSMVIPMNVFYASNQYYHELVFLMQGAAFVALFFQNYGFTLNCQRQSELNKMKGCVTITLITLLWSRLFRYCFLGFSLLTVFHADESSTMFWFGTAVFSMMGLFNVLIIADAFKKFFKFTFMTYVPNANDDSGVQRPVHLLGADNICETSKKQA